MNTFYTTCTCTCGSCDELLDDCSCDEVTYCTCLAGVGDAEDDTWPEEYDLAGDR